MAFLSRCIRLWGLKGILPLGLQGNSLKEGLVSKSFMLVTQCLPVSLFSPAALNCLRFPLLHIDLVLVYSSCVVVDASSPLADPEDFRKRFTLLVLLRRHCL